MSHWLADFLWKHWYPWLTRLTRNTPVRFLNYGYAEEPPPQNPIPLAPADEPDRPCIQLYHRIAGVIPLHGLTVLEVSCGHGGGASYITRYLKPHTLHAIDRNPRAIEFCTRHHLVDGLSFSTGNALALPFPDNTFDAVINIEASHCYPDLPLFFREVTRVLRPGGHFLYADFRSTSDLPLLDQQLQNSVLDLIRRDDISPQVVRGMQLNTEKYLALIQKLVPTLLKKPAMRFAGVKGSAIYTQLAAGTSTYLAFHLRKALPTEQTKTGL